MNATLQAILDAFLPPKDDVRVARALTTDKIAALMRPAAVKEAWIIALMPYRALEVRALIRAVKFYSEEKPLPALAEAAHGLILEMVAGRKLMNGWNTPLLIPVPSSPARLKERGYNQAERIADSFAAAMRGSVIYAPRALSRLDRKSQVRVARKKRNENIRGAFYASDEGAVAGRHVILMDDVVESGATMKDARRALVAAGALDVLGIAITH